MGIDITQWRIQIARYWKYAGRMRHRRGKFQKVKTASSTLCTPLLGLILSFCLITAPSLLLVAGDVEKNPGPPKLRKAEAQTSPNLKTLSGLRTDQLKAIEMSNPAAGVERWKSEMLDKWLRSDPNASWKNVVAALQNMEEHAVAKRVMQTYIQIEKAVAGKFGKLLLLVHTKFQKEPELINKEDFLLFLGSILPSEVLNCLPQSSDLKDIFKAITFNKLWSFLDYHLLEQIVEQFWESDQELAGRMEQYKEDLSGYQIATKVKDHIAAALQLGAETSAFTNDSESLLLTGTTYDPKYFKELSIKLDEPFSDYTLDYLCRLWTSLKKILRLPPLTLLLHKIHKGCICVTWLIPTHLVPQAKERARQNAKFFEGYMYPILRVIIDGELAYEVKPIVLDLEGKNSEGMELQETGQRESGPWEYTLDTPELKSGRSSVADGSTSPTGTPSGIELSINDLGIIQAEAFAASAKWFDIGLILNVPGVTLDRICSQFEDPSDRLQETLKTWFETAAEPTWQDMIGALKDVTVGYSKLANEIEAKHCTIAETSETIPEGHLPQQPTTGETQLQSLQQALQESQELLRIKDKELQYSQRCMDTLQQELRDSQKHMDTLKQELQDSLEMLRIKDQKLQNSLIQIQELTDHVEEKQHTIDDREKQIQQLNQQAVKDKQASQRQLQELNQQLKRAVEQPQETITQLKQQTQQQMEHAVEAREGQLWEPIQQLQEIERVPAPIYVMQQKTIQDMRKQKEFKAPEKMCRGSAASDSNIAYFNGGGSTKVHSYDFDTQKWHQLPDTPLEDSTLVVVQQMLTMVGGYVSGKVTDSLLSLMEEAEAMKWLPYFPAMPTAWDYTAAVCSGHSLIVAGGSDGTNSLAIVEVLDMDTQQWSTACSLPHPFYRATISICGEQLYMMGGGNQTGGTPSVITCSVHELLQCQTQLLAGKPQTAPAKETTIWWQVADAPYYSSSCATLRGQLVAVGGWDEALQNTTAIFAYNETNDLWEAVGNMSTARSWALVAILNEKMMVIGGCVSDYGTLTDVVEYFVEKNSYSC